MATAEEEDFTFPATTTAPPPRFFDSPPLWRPSSSHLVKPQAYDEKRNEMNRDEDEDEEEKMDMLWEDLNDEFSRKNAANSDASSPGREVQINCVRALKLSKANGQMVSGMKPNILVFIKILKKVFFMHNSHGTIGKGSW